MKQENMAAIVGVTIGLFTGLALGQSKIQKQRELKKQQALEIARLKLEADTLDAKIAELASAKIEPKVIEYLDKVMFMDQGVVVEQGTPDLVFNQSQNKRLSSFLERFSRT